MPSSEWDNRNRILFPIYLIRACDFKGITDFDPPATSVSAAVYEKHNVDFKEEYKEPGMAEDPVADKDQTADEERGKENRQQQEDENAYELSALDDDLLDNEPYQLEMRHLSIRNFV
jgi:hypothetical protein